MSSPGRTDGKDEVTAESAERHGNLALAVLIMHPQADFKSVRYGFYIYCPCLAIVRIAGPV